MTQIHAILKTPADLYHMYLKPLSIRRLIRNFLAGCLGMIMNRLGLVDKAKRRITPGYILPLCFHNPQIKLFERVIFWLKQNEFNLISTAQLLEILQKGTAPIEKMAWITFDDGWRDNIRNVIPLLIEYNIPATFFITTAPVESIDGQFWFSFARRNRNYFSHPYCTYIEELWSLTESKRGEIIKSVKNRKREFRKRDAMTISELQAIAKIPDITIGSHTDNHPITAYCTVSELEGEIATSKRKLEAWLGKEIYFFAYPKGLGSRRDRSILQQQGFLLATILEPTFISPNSHRTIDVFRVPRIAIPDTGYFTEIECHLVGVWQPFICFVKRILKVSAASPDLSL